MHAARCGSGAPGAVEPRVNVVPLFPDFFRGPLGLSIPARAAAAGLVEYRLVQLRDFTDDRAPTRAHRPPAARQAGRRRGWWSTAWCSCATSRTTGTRPWTTCRTAAEAGW